jgi:hypothetical protein
VLKILSRNKIENTCTVLSSAFLLMAGEMLRISNSRTVFLAEQSPHLRTPNPGFNQGFNPPPPLYVTNVGGELRVKPRVWRPEMWAQEQSLGQFETNAVFLFRKLHTKEIVSGGGNNFRFPHVNDLYRLSANLLASDYLWFIWSPH